MKIAFVGSKGSGKDFLADELIKVAPSYTKIAWADTLKSYCDSKYNNLHLYNTHEAKDTVVMERWNKANETAREIWERESCEVAATDDRFFHKITLEEIKHAEDIIVTDTRNDYEYEDLKELGFIIIYITRPEKPVFQGYDQRIESFYKDIRITYNNKGNPENFINLLKGLK